MLHLSTPFCSSTYAAARYRAATLAGLLGLLAPLAGHAQSAVQPDATFGTAGLASVGLDCANPQISNTTPAQYVVTRPGQVVRAGNRLLVAGRSGAISSFVVKGFQLNGQPDATFGTNGALTLTQTNAECRSLTVLPSGQVVAAGARHGFINDAPIFAQFSPSGVLDASFGAGGVLSVDPDGGSFPDAGVEQVVALLNGNLLAWASRADGTGNARLISVLPTGQLNTAFNNGLAYTTLVDIQLHQLLRLADGRVLAAGIGPLLSGNTKQPAAVLRLTATGQPDASFGTNGLALINGTQTTGGTTSPAFTEAFGVSVQPTDGKIVLAGRVKYDASASAGNLPVLLRLNPDGTPDVAFNTAAARLLYDTGTFQCVAAQPNGTIVAGGHSAPPVPGVGPQFLLARYTAAGQLDATFNPARAGYSPAGAYTQSRASNAATASGLLVDPAGSILTLGGFEARAGQTNPFGLLLARYTVSSMLSTRAGAAVLGLQASPVPAAETVQLRYALPTAAPVRAQLHDALGRPVGAPVAVAAQPAGPHSLALDVRGLAPGVYVCTLEAGTAWQSIRLVVAP